MSRLGHQKTKKVVQMTRVQIQQKRKELEKKLEQDWRSVRQARLLKEQLEELQTRCRHYGKRRAYRGSIFDPTDKQVVCDDCGKQLADTW